MIEFIAAGVRAKVASGDMAPGFQAGTADGDIYICIASQRDNFASSMTGSVVEVGSFSRRTLLVSPWRSM